MKIVIACTDSERDSVTRNREYCVYKISQDELYHIFNDECKAIIPMYTQFKNIPYYQVKKYIISKFGNEKYQELISEITKQIKRKSSKGTLQEIQSQIGQLVSDEIIEAYCYLNHIPFDFRKIK